MLLIPEHLETRMQIGLWGEYAVQKTLRDKGFDTHKPRIGDGGDILACGLRIEVKTAREGKDHRYRFCLTKDGCTCHTKSDVCILLLISSSGLVTTFVVPCIALQNKKNLTLPKPYGYRGKYAEYKKPIIDGLRRITQ